MSAKGSVLYEKGRQSDSDQEDAWDDKMLNKAYDRAIKYAKLKVAKRICESTNTLQSPEPKTTPYEIHSTKDNKKSKQSKKSKKSQRLWRVGDNCRAVYSSDGLEYEAQIVEFLSDDTVLVNFSGYGNEETVALSSLKESCGPHVISQQARRAALVNMCESDMNNEILVNGDFYPSKKSRSKKNKTLPDMPDISGMGNIPPPFCIPPTLHPTGPDGVGGAGFMGLGGLIGSNGSSGSDNGPLTAMLVSWYLSGYYTGYYQGVSQGDKDKRKSRKGT